MQVAVCVNVHHRANNGQQVASLGPFWGANEIATLEVCCHPSFNEDATSELCHHLQFNEKALCWSPPPL